MTVDKDMFGLIVNVVSLVSGTMTIFGLSGLVTWSLFKKERGYFDNKVLSIFAFSIKSFLCSILLLIMYGLSAFPYGFVIMLYKGHLGADFFYWDEKAPIVYILAYLFAALLAVPIFCILATCIYSWSLRPIVKLWRIFTRSGQV